MAKKQGELKGMPPKTELEKQADKVVEKWEDLQKKKAALTAEKLALMPMMKKANRSEVFALDSMGIKRKVGYNESEAISVTKAAGEEEV